jgi:mannose-6-phosphate isomerase-like protein (cupin superfamily)
MLVTGKPHVVRPGHGRSVDLGVASMRLLGASEWFGGAFSLTEFSGTSEGPWTVPHLHEEFEESFYILDGSFTFSVGDETVEAGAGTYLVVPRGTSHTFTAAAGGGRFLTLMVPGGLEEMFFELGELEGDAITDPAARRAVAERFDSIPVAQPSERV